MRRRWMTWAAAAVLLVSACSDPAATEQQIYEVEVAGERFRIALTTPAQIERADALLASGAENNVHGTLRRGSGGFNSPYTWHLDPATVTFPDLTMEVCDGRPQSDVQSDVDYWVDTVKYYCPWGARIVARID